MPNTHRYLTLAGAVGELRTASFNGVSHIVVPVVMMVEGVVWAMNSVRPELVPRDELARAPKGWNGRPVVGSHPTRQGTPISANEPSVLEAEAFGTVFGADMKVDRLVAEAWIDTVRASRSGTQGERVLERLQRYLEGDRDAMIEVSVGAFMNSEDATGVFKGKTYAGIWRDIVPDHLAFLPEGSTGACSNDAGCGAPRTARSYIVTAEGLKERESLMAATMTTEPEKKPTLKERIAALMRFRSAADEDAMSDVELRSALDGALRATEPGYLGIDAVFASESLVVYAVAPSDVVQLFRRGFTVTSSGVTLADEKERVEPVTRYEPVTAEGKRPNTTCGCGGKAPTTATATTTTNGGSKMEKTKKDGIIAALIASERSLFTKDDQAMLEALTDERLTKLETDLAALTAKVEPTKVEPTTATTPTTAASNVVDETKTQTVDQYIAAAPTVLQEALRESLRVTTERRASVTAALKATQRCKFTDEQLASYSVAHLENLLELAGGGTVTTASVTPTLKTTRPVNFGLRAVTSPTSTDDVVDEPPDMIGQMVTAAAAARK